MKENLLKPIKKCLKCAHYLVTAVFFLVSSVATILVILSCKLLDTVSRMLKKGLLAITRGASPAMCDEFFADINAL